MGKATGVLLAVLSFSAASYVLVAPDNERATSDKLANLVRIAAEGTRTVAQSNPRAERAAPRPALIADQTAATEKPRAAVLAQAATPAAPSAGASAREPESRRGGVKPVDDEARRALARSIQAELKRVGCFDGDVDGAWNTATRNALKVFIDRINATLPVNEPDYILLTLLQGNKNAVCGKDCPTGQVAANDGRCQPKAIVAQATRLVPKRDAQLRGTSDAGQRAAIAQVSPGQPAELTEPNRRAVLDAQLKAAEEARARSLAAADETRRQAADAERQAKREAERLAIDAENRARAEAIRLAQSRTADEQRAKTAAAVAAEARAKQLALDEQNRAKAEAQRAALARALDEQRTRTEAAASEAQRHQLQLAEQQRAKAETQRLIEARIADEQRLKAVAAAEEVRRRQLVLDQQNRSTTEAQRLAEARIAEDRRLKQAAAAEEARRNQLVEAQRKTSTEVASMQNRPNNQAVPALPAPQVLASVNIDTGPAAPAAPVTASSTGTQTLAVPFVTGSTAPAAPVAAETPPSAPTVSTPAAPSSKQPARKAAADQPAGRSAPRRQQNSEPRFVQRFVPPSYVGRTEPAQRRANYQPPSARSGGGGGGGSTNGDWRSMAFRGN